MIRYGILYILVIAIFIALILIRGSHIYSPDMLI